MSALIETRSNPRVQHRRRRTPLRRAAGLVARAPHPAVVLALVAALISVGAAQTSGPVAPAIRTASNVSGGYVSTTGATRTMYTSPSTGLSSARIYRAITHVRAVGRTTIARLQVRQVQNGRVVASRLVSIYAYSNHTRTMIASLQPRSGGGYLQVRVRASGTRPAKAYFSGLHVFSYARSAAPTASTSSSSGCTSGATGLPVWGQAYAGQTASGAVSLSSRESSYGRSVGVHRIYAQSDNVDSAARIAADDVAHKRLPWISFTVPGSWASMASGAHDAWARGVISKLNAVHGPVWLVFAHEPEHSRQQQHVSDWVRMQQRLLPMVKKYSDNIATSIILEGYWQVARTDRTLTLDALWPGDYKVDVIGMDSYNFYGTKQGGTGKMMWEMTDLRPWFKVFRDFASAHHARWGVAETGYTDAAASKQVSWITNTYSYLKAYGGVAMSYFDTSLNTGGFTWALNPSAKRAQWGSAVRGSTHIC